MVRERFQFDRCTLEVWSPRPWLLATRVAGHLQRAAARRIVEHRNLLLPNVPLFEEFHDWMDMTGYDTASRRELTTHSLEHRSKIAGIHVLTDSNIIKMGVAVAAIALGDMLQSYARRDYFEGLFEVASTAPPQDRDPPNEQQTLL